MTYPNCPYCGSPAQPVTDRSRIHYACETISRASDGRTIHQTELCVAWRKLQAISRLVTTDHESKDDFIHRVKAVLYN
jgi:hypothetical protein